MSGKPGREVARPEKVPKVQPVTVHEALPTGGGHGEVKGGEKSSAFQQRSGFHQGQGQALGQLGPPAALPPIVSTSCMADPSMFLMLALRVWSPNHCVCVCVLHFRYIYFLYCISDT